MRAVVAGILAGWLSVAFAFLGYALTVALQDYREARESHAEMRQRQRFAAAMEREAS